MTSEMESPIPEPVADREIALSVQGLQHRFKDHKALVDVSFEVESGVIHGFVGPNGAGKTTTLKVIGTLLAPQVGRVEVFGRSIVGSVRRVRRQIGYMPDHFAMYKQMTVFEYLDFFAAAYGQSVAERNRTISDVLELTDMSQRGDSLIKGLSRGMQQRVSLARVLVHDPQLLLLDEPASGLDPRARIELMEILRALSEMGKTVFISSHILSELATLCSSVTIIDRGRVKYSGQMEQLLTQTEGDHAEFVLQIARVVPNLVTALASIDGVSDVDVSEHHDTETTIAFDPHVVNTGKILETAIRQGADVVSFQRNRRHLDEAFMDLTEPGVRS
jgi:ABC-2 type transport system ATP-binding protein